MYRGVAWRWSLALCPMCDWLALRVIALLDHGRCGSYHLHVDARPLVNRHGSAWRELTCVASGCCCMYVVGIGETASCTGACADRGGAVGARCPTKVCDPTTCLDLGRHGLRGWTVVDKLVRALFSILG